MYVEDLKNDFYEFLTGKRICVVIHYDIDSICTCKILQALLKHKQTPYTLAVVQTISDLRAVYNEHSSDVKHFVLVNCGGTIDLVDVLEPDDDVVFFVLDAHRPTELCNIYSNGQVRLLSDANDDANVPEFDDVFREDESDEEVAGEREGDAADSDEEMEGNAAKRRRLGEEAIMRRRERRLWEDKREKLLFDYSQFTYYAKASALYMFDLAWKLNKDDKDLLWYAIVALTEQMLFLKLENAHYVLETSHLQAHATRLHNRSSDTDDHTSVRIAFERDLRLALYRHWSAAASLKHSMYPACRLKLWSLKGDTRLHELLADMGLPLAQSRQNYMSMDLKLRDEFHGSLEKLADKYGLADIMYATFTLTYGYRNRYCAADIVYGMLAILEMGGRDKRPDECFQSALDCLSRSQRTLLNGAIARAKSIVTGLFKSVQAAIDMKRIVSAGPFIYYIVPEWGGDGQLFAQPHTLGLLAHFILNAYVVMSRNRKASSLPLIVSAPTGVEGATCMLLGIPPLCENSPKNFFGKAFEQAAERISCDSQCDYFDTAYFQIPTRDRTRFLDALTALLG